MKALKLTITHFDPTENTKYGALHIDDEQIFTEEEHATAHFKLNQYLKEKHFTPYFGWDGQVYPQFKVETVELK